METIQERAQKIRELPQYKKWRKAVLFRDGFKCVLCGIQQNKIKGVVLEVDHIKPFILNPNEIFSLSNGRTLCKPCHKRTETYGNTKEYREARYLDIHPFLVGDFLYKLEKLPSSIKFSDGMTAGIILKYKCESKKWSVGYGRNASFPFYDTSGDTPNEAIDKLYMALKMANKKAFSPVSFSLNPQETG